MPRSNPDLQKMVEEKDIRGLSNLLKGSNSVMRQEAAEALAKINDPRAAEPLIRAMHSQSSLHWHARLALARMGAPAVGPLIAVLGGSDADFRFIAASLLGTIGAPAVEPLIAELHNPKPWVPFHAIRALGETKDARAIDPLLKVLADPDPELRREAAGALGKIKDVRAVDALTAALKDTNSSVRWEAEEALKAIQEAVSEPPSAAVPHQPVMREQGIAESLPAPRSEPSGETPDPSDEQEYVRRCLQVEFTEEPETRTYRSDPAFATVLTPLNALQFGQAIQAGQALLPLFPDFDLIYKWMGSAYRRSQQLPQSRTILTEGLGKAKRKSVLLTDLGETEWQDGDIHAAVYWWSQALHSLASDPIDHNVYLLLAYVAHEVGLLDFEQALLEQVDFQVRLDLSTAARLTTLVRNQKTPALQRALAGLQSKYFPIENEHNQ